MTRFPQPYLFFDQPGSHRDDPLTSYIAAEKLAKSGGWTAQQEEVYKALENRNGGTSGEIGMIMPGNKTANRFKVSRRMSELKEKGLVVEGPRRICKVQDSLCCTWWLTGTEPKK